MIRTWTHQTVVVICILFSGISAKVNLSVSYESDTEPDVYRDEPLKLMCKAEKVTNDSFKLAFNFLKNGEVDTSIGCAVDHPRGAALTGVLTGDLRDLAILEPTNEVCGLLPGDKLSVTLNATSQLSDYTIRCVYYTFYLGNGPADVTSELSMPQIKVAPQGLTMSMTPEHVQEREEFEAMCKSTGEASPSSSYKYDILRDGMPIVENQTHGRYTPTKDDRLGFSVRCRDTAHPNWRNQADIIATSQTMYAEFIDIGDNAGSKREKHLNPTYITNKLVCDLIAHNEAEIAYSWVSAIVQENKTSTRALTLDARQMMADEVITCKGTVGNLSKSITWNITWDVHATTTIGNKATRLTTTAGLYRGAIVMIIIMVQA